MFKTLRVPATEQIELVTHTQSVMGTETCNVAFTAAKPAQSQNSNEQQQGSEPNYSSNNYFRGSSSNGYRRGNNYQSERGRPTERRFFGRSKYNNTSSKAHNRPDLYCYNCKATGHSYRYCNLPDMRQSFSFRPLSRGRVFSRPSMRSSYNRFRQRGDYQRSTFVVYTEEGEPMEIEQEIPTSYDEEEEFGEEEETKPDHSTATEANAITVKESPKNE